MREIIKNSCLESLILLFYLRELSFCEMELIHLYADDFFWSICDEGIIPELRTKSPYVLFFFCDLSSEPLSFLFDLTSIDMSVDIDIDTTDDTIGISETFLCTSLESEGIYTSQSLHERGICFERLMMDRRSDDDDITVLSRFDS